MDGRPNLVIKAILYYSLVGFQLLTIGQNRFKLFQVQVNRTGAPHM